MLCCFFLRGVGGNPSKKKTLCDGFPTLRKKMLVQSTVVQLEGGFRCGAFRVGVSQVIPIPDGSVRLVWGSWLAFLARTPNDRLLFFFLGGGELYGKHHHL